MKDFLNRLLEQNPQAVAEALSCEPEEVVSELESLFVFSDGEHCNICGESVLYDHDLNCISNPKYKLPEPSPVSKILNKIHHWVFTRALQCKTEMSYNQFGVLIHVGPTDKSSSMLGDLMTWQADELAPLMSSETLKKRVRENSSFEN